MLSVVLLVGLFVGLILFSDSGGKSIIGWIFVTLAAIYVIVGIVLKVFSAYTK